MRKQTRQKSRTFDGKKYRLLLNAKEMVFFLILAFLLLRFIIGFSIVHGNSMEPTLYDGEIVFYTRVNFGYAPGDIVSVRMPNGDYYVKRVVAAAGDVVDLKDGILYVNGRAEAQNDTNEETLEQKGSVVYPCTLGENQYFVLGDNRAESVDSRAFGAVSESQIKGKLWLHFGAFYIRTLY